MSRKQAPPPPPPKPSFVYQGSGLSVLEVDMLVGPFSFAAYPGRSFGHAVAIGDLDGVPQTVLRPQAYAVKTDPCTNHFVMGYDQCGTSWEMIFRLTTDPAGGLVGGAFSLEVDSNYPQTPMSIAKSVINQPSYGVLVHRTLPCDYRAQVTARYWANGRKEPPLDAWMMLEIGYIPDEERGKPLPETLPSAMPIPMVSLGSVVLYPAHAESQGGVLGNNYVKQLRHAR